MLKLAARWIFWSWVEGVEEEWVMAKGVEVVVGVEEFFLNSDIPLPLEVRTSMSEVAAPDRQIQTTTEKTERIPLLIPKLYLMEEEGGVRLGEVLPLHWMEVMVVAVAEVPLETIQPEVHKALVEMELLGKVFLEEIVRGKLGTK